MSHFSLRWFLQMKLTISSLAVRTPTTNSDPASTHSKAPRLSIEVKGWKGVLLASAPKRSLRPDLSNVCKSGVDEAMHQSNAKENVRGIEEATATKTEDRRLLEFVFAINHLRLNIRSLHFRRRATFGSVQQFATTLHILDRLSDNVQQHI